MLLYKQGFSKVQILQETLEFHSDGSIIFEFAKFLEYSKKSIFCENSIHRVLKDHKGSIATVVHTLKLLSLLYQDFRVEKSQSIIKKIIFLKHSYVVYISYHKRPKLHFKKKTRGKSFYSPAWLKVKDDGVNGIPCGGSIQ